MMGKPAIRSRSEARVLRRRHAILKVARGHFLERGFHGVPMSCIAADIGGSKSTLWTYFPSKEHLFMAVVDHEIAALVTALADWSPSAGRAHANLEAFGEHYLHIMTTPAAIGLERLVYAEVERLPGLGASFDQRHALVVATLIGPVLEKMLGPSQEAAPGTMKLVRAFLALVRSGCHRALLLNPRAMADDEAVKRDAQMATAFLRAAFAGPVDHRHPPWTGQEPSEGQNGAGSRRSF